MAKITPSALITAIQGKWHGSCFQMWKGAIVVRRSPRPRKITSESRFNFRGTVSSISGCFYSMTTNQRVAWRCYANLLPTSVTGYNAFMARGVALEIACHSDLCIYFDAPGAYAPPMSPAPISLCYHPSNARYCVMWTNPNCASVYVQGMLSVQAMFSNEKSPKWRIFDTVPSTDLHMIFDASAFPADQMIRFTARSINMRGELSIKAEAKPPPPLPESVTLLYPIGGESLYTGSSCLIEWRSKSIDNVKLEYSTNSGVDWNLITVSVSAYLGQYAWTIPAVESPNYKVKITNTDDPTIYDESGSVFTVITKPWITLLTPNGSEEWTEKSKQNITWSHSNAVNVILKYSIDNGLNYTTITASTPAVDETYEWTVPENLSTQCLVKILVHENQTIYDVSDNTFSIVESQLPGDCVARWIFKTSGYDAGNSRFTDQTGNGRHATNYNGVVSAGYTTMNGTTAYLKISDFLELSADKKHVSAFTWVNGPPNRGGIFAHWYHVDWGVCWEIHYIPDDIWFLITDSWSGTTRKQYRITNTIMDNTLHSVGFTFNNGVFKLFVDGVETAPDFIDNDDAFTVLFDATQPFIHSWRPPGSGSDYNLETKIYSSYLYNKTLTPDEMLTLHNMGG